MATTRLHFTASVEEQWQALVGPWLRELAGAAWRNPEPTVVLTPSRAESFYLRSRLVAEGIPYLGLRFWTPSDVRKFLITETDSRIEAATLAEQRLVARTCAESLVLGAAADSATLNSVIREPGAFLRAYDLLLGAGWEPAREGAIYGRELAKKMERELKALGIATQAGLHRCLRKYISASKEPLIANLLVTGFNAAHWPLWDLLKGTVFAADEAVIALSVPRYFAEDIDQLWNSSWEEVTQSEAITPLSPIIPDETPFADLAASYAQGTTAPLDAADLTFCVTSDLASQVRAIVLQALDYLKRDDCTRLGIVFPEANAVALEVAEELRGLSIPIDDGTGTWMPGLFERRCWQSWVALQEEAGVQSLISWMRACEAQGVSYGLDLPTRTIAGIVESALGESLVDDLDFLADHLEANSDRRHSLVVVDFLRRRIALPDEATFAEFLKLTRQAMEFEGWQDYLAQLKADPPKWLLERDGMLSRRTFLEWLKESTDSRTRTRGAEGNHFYGKVHLLVYAQMSGQTWSHLILTGLNEGVWPRVFEAGAFGSRHELIALNQQARGLNIRSKTQGSQGAGHDTVALDKGYCLLPLERQDLALRDLCAALEGTSAAVCLTSITTEGGRSLLPSDFFNHAYQAKTGGMLDEESFRAMANATEAWCKMHESLFEVKPRVQSSEINATWTAYLARRNLTQPFGPYEFSFAEPPTRPIQLTCKEWESAWNHPSSAWLEEVVGTAPWPEGELSWPRAVGTWVHRWLAAALRDCQDRNSTAEFPIRLLAAADREANAVRNRARLKGIDLYPWWDQVWNQARTIALNLAETLAPMLQDRQFLFEFILPDDLMVALPGADRADFILKGRMDLLLVEPGSVAPDISHNDFTGCACWVVDFKTGSAQILNEKRIGEGKGLQPVLYALAVRALGATSTAISLHTPDAVLKQQVLLEDILENRPLFRSLEKFHRAGIFGMRADADNAYGYSPSYPLATRFVPAGILDAKWALVHGAAPTTEAE